MYIATKTDYIGTTSEELLPEMTPEFPYMSSRAELHRYVDGETPWHWHSALELFYLDQGEIQYQTPGGVWRFTKGSGGLVNADVLHRSRMVRTQPAGSGEECVQLLHLFEPSFLAGEKGSLIETKYLDPVVGNSGLEMIPILPSMGEKAQKLLGMLQLSFTKLREQEIGYELHLRSLLSEIWLELMPLAEKGEGASHSTEKTKQMMRFIGEHYAEKISVKQIAEAAFVSERECYRIFQNNLKCSPVDYVVSVRLEAALNLLKEEDSRKTSIAEVAYATGFGSSSYFGRVFLEKYGMTPRAFRESWQNKEKV